MIKVILILIITGFIIINCGPNDNGSIQNPDYGNPSPELLTCTTSTIAPGTPLALGGAMISCPDGTTSLISNGTVITPIQFCPNPTTYPTTFSEIAFCINGNLWGVYSQNGGFLTEIIPGTYSSDGVNSSCTFTVQPNCIIINN
jgi:hypothetical protein